jgi:hypothetical protein
MQAKISKALISLSILTSLTVSTNAQLSITAEQRNRFELRDGYQQLTPEGSDPAFLIWQRTRISFLFETEYLRLRLTPQDVRLWGDESLRSSSGVFGDDASLELFEGYAELKAGRLGWLSIGRQQLNYDNQRLLASRNWNNNGLSYDALLLKLDIYNWKVHLGSTWNTISEASSGNLYPANRIKTLSFLWLNHTFKNQLSLSLLHIASGATLADTLSNLNFMQTTGFYSDYRKNDLKVWAETYYQYGKDQPGNVVNAFLAAAEVSYKSGNFTPGAGMCYLSGNSRTETSQSDNNLFNILYGARHRFYGFMDYFRNFPSHTGQGGLEDYYIYLGYKITKSVNVQNIGHYFRLAQTNPSTPNDKYLGFENDLVLKYKFSDWGALESGYLFILPSGSLKTLQHIPDNKFPQFFYVQLTLTPTLFNQANQTEHN